MFYFIQDEFSVSDKVALQLAGLQAQVVLGNYQEGKGQRYKEVEQYLCKRILNQRSQDWSQQVALAHKVVLLCLNAMYMSARAHTHTHILTQIVIQFHETRIVQGVSKLYM